MAQLLKISEAARLISCHNVTLHRAIKAGKLAASRVGREYRISEEELRRYLANGSQLVEETGAQENA